MWQVLFVSAFILTTVPLRAAESVLANRPYRLSEGTDVLTIRPVLEAPAFAEERNFQLTINHTRHSELDENLYLIWHIVPAGVGIDLSRDGDRTTAAEWHVDWGAGSGGYVAPTFTSKKKWNWGRRTSGEFKLQYAYVYPLTAHYSYWRFGFEAGPIYHVNGKLAVGWKVNPVISNVSLSKVLLGDDDPRLGRGVTQVALGPVVDFAPNESISFRGEAAATTTEYGDFGSLFSAYLDVYF